MGVIKGAKRGPYKKNKVTDVAKRVKENLDAIEKIEPLDSYNKDWKEVIEVESEASIENQIEDVQNIVAEDVRLHIEKSGDQELDEFLKGFKNVTPIEKKEEDAIKEDEYKPQKKRKVSRNDSEREIIDSNSQMFNGTMLIAMCDFFFPSVLKFLFGTFLGNKNAKKVQHKDVVLNPDQVKSLEGVSDHAAKVIFEKVHPMVLFVIGMGVMYGMNFKMALDNVERKIIK